MSNTFNPTNNYKDYFFSDNTGVSIPILSYIFVPVVTLFLAFSIIPKKKEDTVLEQLQNIVPSQTGGTNNKTKSKKNNKKIHRKTKRHL